MGLVTDLTYLHMEAFTAIDRIDRGLQRLHRHRTDVDQMRRVVDELASTALRLRRDLVSFFDREQEELFPRIRRIFGADIRELRSLVHSQSTVINSLERFIAELTDDEQPQRRHLSERLSGVQEAFEAFVTSFEERCEIERGFYATYSTMLFPGGLATE